MDTYNVQKKLDEEKEFKRHSLEKQYHQWETRRAELRKVSLTALDPAFVRRNIDKCSAEMERISKLIESI